MGVEVEAEVEVEVEVSPEIDIEVEVEIDAPEIEVEIEAPVQGSLEIEANIDVPLVEAEVGGSSGNQGPQDPCCCTVMAVIFGLLLLGAIVATICAFIGATGNYGLVQWVLVASSGLFLM